MNLAIVSFLAKAEESAHHREVLPQKIIFEISFRNLKAYRVIALALFCLNSYDVIQKVRGYVSWQEGQVAVMSGRLQKGIEDYQKALKFLPHKGELKFHLGGAYAYIGQPEKALPFIKQAQSNFNDKNIYIAQGSALFQLGHYEKAEESFKTALRMYPHLLLPRLWLAELYLQRNRIEEAVNRLNEIKTIQPKVMTEEIRQIKRDAEKLLEKYSTQSKF